jgi:hypothetical protein
MAEDRHASQLSSQGEGKIRIFLAGVRYNGVAMVTAPVSSLMPDEVCRLLDENPGRMG